MKRHGRLVGSSGREEGVDTSPQEEEERRRVVNNVPLRGTLNEPLH